MELGLLGGANSGGAFGEFFEDDSNLAHDFVRAYGACHNRADGHLQLPRADKIQRPAQLPLLAEDFTRMQRKRTAALLGSDLLQHHAGGAALLSEGDTVSVEMVLFRGLHDGHKRGVSFGNPHDLTDKAREFHSIVVVRTLDVVTGDGHIPDAVGHVAHASGKASAEGHGDVRGISHDAGKTSANGHMLDMSIISEGKKAGRSMVKKQAGLTDDSAFISKGGETHPCVAHLVCVRALNPWVDKDANLAFAQDEQAVSRLALKADDVVLAVFAYGM